MLCKVNSLAFRGLDPIAVDVEVSISGTGLPAFDIVGLPNKSIEESKHRVKSAIRNSGLSFPNRKIIVNLAPGDIHKEGSFYDLAIAVGIICANENIQLPGNLLVFGELSLDGTIRHTKGTLNAALFALAKGYDGLVIALLSCDVAKTCGNLNIYGFTNLTQLYMHISGKRRIEAYSSSSGNIHKIPNHNHFSDFASMDEVVGHSFAKKMLAVGVAGGHHMLLVGSPGVGKTLLAGSINSILPRLTEKESLEIAKIYSYIGGESHDNPILEYPPIRNPHHSTTYVGMIGGGSYPNPGEVTLAHLGILFMDEFCEFSRSVIEVLRQPLESGYISLTRSSYKVKFPANFTLLAVSNPCKCGFKGDDSHKCTCTDREVHTYLGKLSGPILDRIDMLSYIRKCPNVLKNSVNKATSVSASTLLELVERARVAQRKRYGDTAFLLNRHLTASSLKRFASLSRSVGLLLQQALDTYNVSSRGCHKIIRVARTIADMNGHTQITEEDMLESIQYKCDTIL